MLYNFSRKIDDADVDTEPFIERTMSSLISFEKGVV